MSPRPRPERAAAGSAAQAAPRAGSAERELLDRAGALGVAPRVLGGRAVVPVKALPNAPRSGLAGVRGGEVAIRVAAAPDKGRANEELVRFLADRLGIAKSAVALETGATNRHKAVSLPVEAAAELLALLGEATGGAEPSG